MISGFIPDCKTLNMDDSRDTVIVVGCGKLKGPQFIEMFKGVGPIKVRTSYVRAFECACGGSLAGIHAEKKRRSIVHIK